jgi:archaellin
MTAITGCVSPDDDEEEEETPPEDDIEEETPPEDDIEEETPPEDDIEDETSPEDDIEDETSPEDDIEDETPPEDDIEEETPPEDDIEDETPPEEQSGLSIKVQHFEGHVNETGDEIDELQIHIVLYGGSEALNMLDLLIHASGTDNEEAPVGFSDDFLHDDAPNPGGMPTYTVTEITDPLDSYDEDSGKYLLDTESTLRLDMDIDTVLSDGLSPLSEISLKFMIAGGGATTTESATTPGTYEAGEWVVLK